MEGGQLAGAVVLITGGANGIGAGVARRVAESDARVVVADLDEEAGRALADEVGGAFVRCDVGEFGDCQAAVGAAVERFGGLDVAFLNAGIGTRTDPTDLDVEEYRRVMRVNLDGVVFGAAAARPALLDRGGGQIVATASLAGLTGVPPDPIYAANKHAVVGLVRSLGPAWVADGIRVNALCPGFTDTAIIDDVRELLASVALPLLGVADVVEAFMAVIGSDEVGSCWYVQPGRAPEPFRFRNLPGPRTAAGEPIV